MVWWSILTRIWAKTKNVPKLEYIILSTTIDSAEQTMINTKAGFPVSTICSLARETMLNNHSYGYAITVEISTPKKNII